MEINVGDYVRTKNGYIYKIEDGEEFYEDYVDVGIGTIPDVDGIWVDKAHFQYVDKREIIKSSPNIIDLIEVGDYVNGEKVVEVRQHLHNDIEIVVTNGKITWSFAKNDANYQIKSIVTHEQMEAMEYRINE